MLQLSGIQQPLLELSEPSGTVWSPFKQRASQLQSLSGHRPELGLPDTYEYLLRPPEMYERACQGVCVCVAVPLNQRRGSPNNTPFHLLKSLELLLYTHISGSDRFPLIPTAENSTPSSANGRARLPSNARRPALSPPAAD